MHKLFSVFQHKQFKLQPTSAPTIVLTEYYSPDELGGIGGAAIDFGTNNATTATDLGTSTSNATTAANIDNFGTITNYTKKTTANQLP